MTLFNLVLDHSPTSLTLFWFGIQFKFCVFCFVFTTRPHLWRISATYPPNRGGRGCSRGLTNSAKSSRKRWIRGRSSSTIQPSFTHLRLMKLRWNWMQGSKDQRNHYNVFLIKTVTKMRIWTMLFFSFVSQLIFVCFRDALNKMKDVYEKNPQMGDPNSLQPKISETMCNMEKLRSEIHKNEVRKL